MADGVIVCEVVPSGAVAATLAWIWEHPWGMRAEDPPPGALTRHRRADLVVTVYRSGKVTLQGAGAAHAAERLPPLVTLMDKAPHPGKRP